MNRLSQNSDQVCRLCCFLCVQFLPGYRVLKDLPDPVIGTSSSDVGISVSTSVSTQSERSDSSVRMLGASVGVQLVGGLGGIVK